MPASDERKHVFAVIFAGVFLVLGGVLGGNIDRFDGFDEGTLNDFH